MSNPQTFGEVLRAGRLSRGISAGQLAEQLDRSKASIRSWERNEVEPPPADVERLIELLELDRTVLTEVEAANDSLPADPSEEPPDDGDGGAAETADDSTDGDGADVVSPGEPRDDDEEPSLDEDAVPVEVEDVEVEDVEVEDEGDAVREAPALAEEDDEVDAEADTIAHAMLPEAVLFEAGPSRDDEAPDAEAFGSLNPVRPVRSGAEATSSTATATSSLLEAAPRVGFFAAIRDPERPWLGYIRAFLTVVVLAVLGWAFVWALRELFAAVQDLRGSDPEGIPDNVQALALILPMLERGGRWRRGSRAEASRAGSGPGSLPV